MTYKFVISVETYNKINNYKKYLELHGPKHAGPSLQKILRNSDFNPIKPTLDKIAISTLSVEEFAYYLIQGIQFDLTKYQGTVDEQLDRMDYNEAEKSIIKDFEAARVFMEEESHLNSESSDFDSSEADQEDEIILEVKLSDSINKPFKLYEGMKDIQQSGVHSKNMEITSNLGSYFSHFSPVAEVFETTTHPHARTWRTSFKQKFIDSYYVLAGRMPILEDRAHFGIFDFITGFIPAALLLLLNWSFNQGYVLPTFILAIINLPFVVARVVFGLVTASVFSFVTGFISIITSLLAEKTTKKALELEGTLANGNPASLANFLKDNELDLEKVNARIIRIPTADKTAIQNNYALELEIKREQKFSSVGCIGCETGDCAEEHRAPFTVKFNTDNPSNAKNLHAFFELNIGGVVTGVEEGRLDPESKLNILGMGTKQ